MNFRLENQKLTREILRELDALPSVPPHIKTIAGILPPIKLLVDLIDLPHDAADAYRFLVVSNARANRRNGVLNRAAQHALDDYERAIANEQRAYNALARSLTKKIGR